MHSCFNDWFSKAAAQPDPIAETAGHAKTPQGRINFLLLGCALQQSINLWELQNFLTELLKITDDVAEVPALPENAITDIIAKTHLQNWSLAPQAAGIIWSVGRFARARENRLELWAAGKSSREIWKECGDIFYMGKNSGIRPKALWFLHRLKIRDVPLPISSGARRWLLQAKLYDPNESPKEKLKTANGLYKDLCPKNPALACHALQFFAEPAPLTPTSEKNGAENFYFCQRIFPCDLCPVSYYCRWHS